MFVMLQLPFVDLRGLFEGSHGRLLRPDWRADDPGDCFVKNFGGMVTRNAKAYGLVGERAYIDFERALAFPQPGAHSQDGWHGSIPLRLWFRRLYFDGDISGRFEIGFNTFFDAENDVFKAGTPPYDLPLLARSVCDLPVEVRHPDGTRTTSSLEKCGSDLGLAYLAATTTTARRNEFPAHELMGMVFKVGAASIHIRTNANKPVLVPADRRDLVTEGEDHMFLTSVAKAQRRNTMTVQISPPHTEELPVERARRVLFAHLNAVLHANDFLVATMDPKLISRHRVSLKDLTERAIERFGKLNVSAPKTDGDAAFSKALAVFSDQNAGRVDDIVSKLDALAQDASAPSRLEKIGGWTKGWTEFLANSAISASVKAVMAAK